MALILNEEQQLLKDTAKEFVSNNAPINHFREIRDSNDELGYSKDIWKKMVDLGWAGILIPEEYGGLGLPLSVGAAILEEIHRSGCNAAACHAQMYTCLLYTSDAADE